MGSIGESSVASDLAGAPRNYRSIPIPLGLFQVLRDTDIFDPGSDNFNPLRAIEYAANPIHFGINRESNSAGAALVQDLVNGNISRDLNAYRGFKPESRLSARGLAAPSWGKSFRVSGASDRPSHGIYVGAGPYITVGTDVTIDEQLIGILSSATETYLPNSSFTIENATNGQAAAAVTAGYRLRLPVFALSSGSDRDGLYIGANYNYLYGIYYDGAGLDLQFDTDDEGLITLQPATTPLQIVRESSNKGRGFSLDLSAAVVSGPWNIRLAANGVGNRIDWENLRAEQFTLSSLLDGLDFTETDLPDPDGTRRLELPIRYLGGAGYYTNRWTAEAEVSHGLQDFEFNSGAEYRLAVLEFRGGGRYSRDLWHPSGGVGLNITRGFGIDFAAFSNATNIERERRMSLALSLRIGGESSQ